MHAAGENPRLHRRAVSVRAQQPARVDVRQARVKPLACLIFPCEADNLRPAAQRRDVVRRVTGAARNNLRRIVLKNEHRRLARYARDAAVDELVGDQIADHRNAARGKCIEQTEETRFRQRGQPLF
jgi:hypothetical protein